MGHNKDQTKQTTANMPRESSQAGTHGQTGSMQGGDQWKEGQASYPGQDIKRDPGDWNDRAQRDMQQGDETKPAQPSGTSPLDKDEHPVNKTRPVQQNR
jgi:hypothetical protein